MVQLIIKSSQKLLKHFNGTIISTSFVLPSGGVFPVTFILDLSDSGSFKLSFGSFLQYCYKLRDVFE